MSRAGNPWRWTEFPGNWSLFDGRGRERATIWKNTESRFTWHTYDDQGTGGENAEDFSVNRAKNECVAALVRQGWAPGGWKVVW